MLVVIWLVEQLQQCGICVGVVFCGYGGKVDCYLLVLDDRISMVQVGDELVLIYQCIGVLVVVVLLCSDVVKVLFSVYDLQMIVIDDGLQYYKFVWDREIVVIDGVCCFGNGWWLFVGLMCEWVLCL